jgi:hypothetical protein
MKYPARFVHRKFPAKRKHLLDHQICLFPAQCPACGPTMAEVGISRAAGVRHLCIACGEIVAEPEACGCG